MILFTVILITVLLSVLILQDAHGTPACPLQEMRAASEVTSAEHATHGTAGRLQAAETWTLAGLQAARIRAEVAS